MKKRLLISSVLMSAVLACALGTGTYAWYQASATQKGTMESTTSNHIGSKVDVTISAAGFNGTFGTFDSLDLTDNNGESYYLSGTQAHKDTEAVKEAKGTFKIDWAKDTSPEQQSAAAGTYTLTLTGSANVALATTEKGTIGVDGGLAGGNSITFTVSVSEAGLLSGNNVEFYYAIRATKQETTGSLTAEDLHTEDKITASLA